MYGYLLKLGLTAKEAEYFLYYLSKMVHSDDPDDIPVRAFKHRLEQVYNFEK